jgi:hypothetical protein
VVRRLRPQQGNQRVRREGVEGNQVHPSGGIYPSESRQAPRSEPPTYVKSPARAPTRPTGTRFNLGSYASPAEPGELPGY